MFAAYGRNTQAGIERRAAMAKARLAREAEAIASKSPSSGPESPARALQRPGPSSPPSESQIASVSLSGPFPAIAPPGASTQAGKPLGERKPPRQITYAEIERRALKLFRSTRTELHSQRRSHSVVFVRQFVMYWAVRRTKLSMPAIGRLMGGRDHTTIIHGKKRYVEKRASMGRTLREAR